MKKKSLITIIGLIFSICIIFVAGDVSSEEYASLNGLKSVKAVFDVRIGDPQSAALHLKLIHDTYKDKSITVITNKPDFVIVFIGESVKWCLKTKRGFLLSNRHLLTRLQALFQ